MKREVTPATRKRDLARLRAQSHHHFSGNPASTVWSCDVVHCLDAKHPQARLPQWGAINRHTSSTSPEGQQGKIRLSATVRTEAQVLRLASGLTPRDRGFADRSPSLTVSSAGRQDRTAAASGRVDGRRFLPMWRRRRWVSTRHPRIIVGRHGGIAEQSGSECLRRWSIRYFPVAFG